MSDLDTVRLRSVMPNDKEFVHTVHDNAYRDVIIQQFGTWDQKVEDTFFEAIWALKDLQIIEYKEERCGFYCVEPMSGSLFLSEIVLMPSAQGKGIGSYLIKKLQLRSTDECKPITLEALKSNTLAKSLYKRLGFVQVGTNDTHIQMVWTPQESV